ncbi:hypothetical protein C0Q70_01444 [Pomacea canaliculata]|uniref:Dual oxidase maturation factor 1 n=2 Tax=Pomacea canaliculata TaxID=400727 RepID=A0A2T7PZH9_POMCA|nr:hypothetical protein C0Q70_01444 [Pomacea canaliculata]
MGLYDAFRQNGAPTFYEAVHIPVEADLVVSGLVFCFVILAASFFLVLPGIRGKERLFAFTRITLSLFIGAVILVSNFAMTWEVSTITSTPTKYKAGIGDDITATIGVNIGLRGINVTLKGEPEKQLNETINYNEHFSWEWRQGRPGFGPFAGRFNQQYRAAQFRGLPLPILWVAEYFTFDGEGIRWGRHYRQAGWYSHIVLWLAFPLWILTNILFFVLLRYGAYFLVMTGAAMVTSNIIWATLRNVNELKIPFSDKHVLEFAFGGSFWICLITGILCIILGVVVYVMDLRCPQLIATFFNADVIQDSEEVQVEKEEPVVSDRREEEDEEDETAEKEADRSASAAAAEPTDDEIYEVRMPQEMRPAQRRFTQRFQKPRRRPPPPVPMRHISNDDGEDYQNMPDEEYENAAALK